MGEFVLSDLVHDDSQSLCIAVRIPDELRGASPSRTNADFD